MTSASKPVDSSSSFFDDDFLEVTSDLQTEAVDTGGRNEYAVLHEPIHFVFHYFSSIPQRIPESTELSLNGRKIRIHGMSEQEKEKEFQDAFNGLLDPAVRKEALHQTLDHFLTQQGAEFPHLVQRHKEILHLLQEPFTSRTLVSFVLGEEFFLRVSPKLKLCWLLSKERLSEFLQLVEHFGKFAAQKRDPLEQQLAQNLKARFSQAKDYLFEEEELEEILPVTRRPLQMPKLELIKRELRRYFRIEDLRREATLQMYEIIAKAAQELSPDQREKLGDDLYEEEDLQAKRTLVLNAGIRVRFDDEDQERVFFDLLTLFIPYSSEILLSPPDIIESSVGEEIVEYLETPFIDKPFFPNGKQVFLQVLSKLTPLIPRFQKQELCEFLQEADRDPKTVVPFVIPADIQQAWDEFFALFIENRNVRLVIQEELLPQVEFLPEYLSIHEKNAKSTLEKLCSSAEVRLVFRQYGGDVCLGSVSSDEFMLNQYYNQCWELDDETVLI